MLHDDTCRPNFPPFVGAHGPNESEGGARARPKGPDRDVSKDDDEGPDDDVSMFLYICFYSGDDTTHKNR